MNYRFLPEAQAEYLEAIAFYQQRGDGLAATLAGEVERAVQHLLALPVAAPAVPGAAGLLRRKRLHRYPYSLIYRAGPQLIQIAAFPHHRKRPVDWVQRLPTADTP